MEFWQPGGAQGAPPVSAPKPLLFSLCHTVSGLLVVGLYNRLCDFRDFLSKQANHQYCSNRALVFIYAFAGTQIGITDFKWNTTGRCGLCYGLRMLCCYQPFVEWVVLGVVMCWAVCLYSTSHNNCLSCINMYTCVIFVFGMLIERQTVFHVKGADCSESIGHVVH